MIKISSYYELLIVIIVLEYNNIYDKKLLKLHDDFGLKIHLFWLF